MQIYKYLDMIKKQLNMKIVLMIILTTAIQSLRAQPDEEEQLNYYHEELNMKFFELKNEKDDSIKDQINDKIYELFEKALKYELSFDYDFDSLKYVFKSRSSDNKLRIYNWNVPYNNGKFKYHGILQYYSKEKRGYKIFKLNDMSDGMVNPQKQKLTHNNWFGALYYQIIYTKYKRKRYYTLLGWDGNDDYTTRKVIDVLYFDKNDEPVFGLPVFKMLRGRNHRVIFEYSNQTTMLLRYDDKKKIIVFDLLVPAKPLYEGKFQFYGPEGTYDGMTFEKGKWIYQQSVDVRNPRTGRQ